MYLDSMIYLCAADPTNLSSDFASFQAKECSDPKWASWGRTQNKWIMETLEEWGKDGSIIYRVLVTHYPMWPLITPLEDYAVLNSKLLPILLENKFDLYLNAHDSLTSFASRNYLQPFETKEQPDFESRIKNSEYWFKS